MKDKNILILDTSSKNLYAVVSKGAKVLSSARYCDNIRHAALFTKAVDEAVNESGLTLKDIDVFACNAGPGSFTGIRIGVAAVKAYLTAFPQAKAITLNTMEIMAEKSNADAFLMNAGRDLYYFSLRKEGIVSYPIIIKEEKAQKLIQNGAEVFDEEKDYTAALAICADRKVKSRAFDNDPTPIYLRKPQAREEFEKKAVVDIGRTAEEIKSMVEIEKQCFAEGEAWTENFYNTDPMHTITKGIFVDGTLVAYGMLCFAAEMGTIATVGVLPQYRSRGYAKAVLEHLIDEAVNKGVKHINLEANKSNHTAINLYKSMGFEIIGERKNYYEHTLFDTKDAYVMSRSYLTI